MSILKVGYYGEKKSKELNALRDKLNEVIDALNKLMEEKK